MIKLEDLTPEIIETITKFRSLPAAMKQYQALQYAKTVCSGAIIQVGDINLLVSMLILTGATKEQIEMGLQFAQQHKFWQ